MAVYIAYIRLTSGDDFMAAESPIDVAADRQISAAEANDVGYWLSWISEFLRKDIDNACNIRFWLERLSKSLAAGEKIQAVTFDRGETYYGDRPIENWLRIILEHDFEGRKLSKILIGNTVIREETGEAGGQNLSSETDAQAQKAMFQDIDSVLARLESGIAAERTAIDALLDRLTGRAS